MFGVCGGTFFVYKGKIMEFDLHDGKTGYYIPDYRELTKEQHKYICEMGFDLVLVDNDNDTRIYKEFSCLEEAIEKNDEYRLDKKWGKSHVLRLCKNLDPKDIGSIYEFESYLRISGMKFHFTHTLYFKRDGEYFRDKFHMSSRGLTEDEIFILKSKGCVFTRDIPANRGEKIQQMACLVPFDAIDGFVIEKKYLDINDYGEIDPKETGEKEVYFLDAKNPDPELWNMLKAHRLIYDMVPYDYRF